jgi:hypothetical protein
MDKSTLASTSTDKINAEPPPSPSSILKTLLDAPSSWMNRKTANSSEDALLAEIIEDHESKVEDNPTRIQFRVSVNEDKAAETITYNKMLEYITRDEESDIQWKFQRIVSHEHKGSQCNVLIEWENGEITSEPLKVIAADDPVSCAIYERENDLLDKPG